MRKKIAQSRIARRAMIGAMTAMMLVNSQMMVVLADDDEPKVEDVEEEIPDTPDPEPTTPDPEPEPEPEPEVKYETVKEEISKPVERPEISQETVEKEAEEARENINNNDNVTGEVTVEVNNDSAVDQASGVSGTEIKDEDGNVIGYENMKVAIDEEGNPAPGEGVTLGIELYDNDDNFLGYESVQVESNIGSIETKEETVDEDTGERTTVEQNTSYKQVTTDLFKVAYRDKIENGAFVWKPVIGPDGKEITEAEFIFNGGERVVVPLVDKNGDRIFEDHFVDGKPVLKKSDKGPSIITVGAAEGAIDAEGKVDANSITKALTFYVDGKDLTALAIVNIDGSISFTQNDDGYIVLKDGDKDVYYEVVDSAEGGSVVQINDTEVWLKGVKSYSAANVSGVDADGGTNSAESGYIDISADKTDEQYTVSFNGDKNVGAGSYGGEHNTINLHYVKGDQGNEDDAYCIDRGTGTSNDLAYVRDDLDDYIRKLFDVDYSVGVWDDDSRADLIDKIRKVASNSLYLDKGDYNKDGVTTTTRDIEDDLNKEQLRKFKERLAQYIIDSEEDKTLLNDLGAGLDEDGNLTISDSGISFEDGIAISQYALWNVTHGIAKNANISGEGERDAFTKFQDQLKGEGSNIYKLGEILCEMDLNKEIYRTDENGKIIEEEKVYTKKDYIEAIFENEEGLNSAVAEIIKDADEKDNKVSLSMELNLDIFESGDDYEIQIKNKDGDVVLFVLKYDKNGDFKIDGESIYEDSEAEERKIKSSFLDTSGNVYKNYGSNEDDKNAYSGSSVVLEVGDLAKKIQNAKINYLVNIADDYIQGKISDSLDKTQLNEGVDIEMNITQDINGGVYIYRSQTLSEFIGSTNDLSKIASAKEKFIKENFKDVSESPSVDDWGLKKGLHFLNEFDFINAENVSSKIDKDKTVKYGIDPVESIKRLELATKQGGVLNELFNKQLLQNSYFSSIIDHNDCREEILNQLNEQLKKIGEQPISVLSDDLSVYDFSALDLVEVYKKYFVDVPSREKGGETERLTIDYFFMSTLSDITNIEWAEFYNNNAKNDNFKDYSADDVLKDITDLYFAFIINDGEDYGSRGLSQTFIGIHDGSNNAVSLNNTFGFTIGLNEHDTSKKLKVPTLQLQEIEQIQKTTEMFREKAQEAYLLKVGETMNTFSSITTGKTLVEKPVKEEPPVVTPPEEKEPPVVTPPEEKEPPVVTPPEEKEPPVVTPPEETEPPVVTPPEENEPPVVTPPEENEPPVVTPPEEEEPPVVTPPVVEDEDEDEEDPEDPAPVTNITNITNITNTPAPTPTPTPVPVPAAVTPLVATAAPAAVIDEVAPLAVVNQNQRQAPEAEIDEVTPLALETVIDEETPLATVIDEEVPLASMMQTGDVASAAIPAALGGIMALGGALALRRRRDDD